MGLESLVASAWAQGSVEGGGVWDGSSAGAAGPLEVFTASIVASLALSGIFSSVATSDRCDLTQFSDCWAARSNSDWSFIFCSFSSLNFSCCHFSSAICANNFILCCRTWSSANSWSDGGLFLVLLSHINHWGGTVLK